MFKKVLAVVLCAVSASGFVACGNEKDKGSEDKSDTVSVSVSFNAMKEFVSAVGQDKVSVSVIIPDGTEAHDFEPKAQDLAGLSTADIFVYNGLGMESWAEKAISSANNPDLITVNASENADIIEKESESEDEHEEEGSEDSHSHGKYDPHLWLGMNGAKTEAENIMEALSKADPDNADFYKENYDSFAKQVDSLYNEYKEKFSTVENKSFVTGHAAFGYLCRDFGLVQNSVKDIYAEGEPSAQQLAKLVEYCKENNVTTIFAEEEASPDVSQTLANEVGAKVQTIYTMETSENGKSYVERMTENLEKIYASLS